MSPETNINKELIRNRLKKILKSINKNQSDLAKKIGMTPQNLYSITSINKKTNTYTIPSISFLIKISTHFPNKINYDYLFTGIGNPIIDKKENTINEGNIIANILNDSKIEYHLGDKINKEDSYLETIKKLKEENNQLKTKIIEIYESQKK